MRLGPARKSLAFFLPIAAVAFAFPSPSAATIEYGVSLDHPDQHLFHVTMTIPVADGDKDVIVQMPAWNTLYQVRDFAYRVRDIHQVESATGVAGSLPLPAKLDKQTWRVDRGGTGSARPRSIVLAYSIFWDDPGPFNSQLNVHHGFLNLAEILMYIPTRRAEETEIAFDKVPLGWNLAAELAAGHEANSFVAPSYDALVDAPVEAGKFEGFEFDSAGAHFRVVLDAGGSNRARLQDALERITAYEVQLMGGAPFRQFTFFVHIGPDPAIGEGGMEHMNSTAIAGPSLDAAASLAAHEFFHVWNVKRIRPQSLEPVDYTKEQYTRSLWFAEGFTDAYTSYTLERTGLWSKKQFYDDLAEQIERVQTRPAHAWQSVEESSLDAWFEKYDGYNAPDRSISYYDKGQILGVLIDLEIRDATDNHKSLDDVFRIMNDKFAKQGKFYDDHTDIRAAIEQVAGKSFDEFFRRYISGVAEIPYNQILGIAGLELKTDSGYTISELGRTTDRQRRMREGMLRGSTD
jgi:predicted metalloprotease with PDZ domain